MRRFALAAAAALVFASGAAAQRPLEFQPKVGAIGVAVRVKGPFPAGSEVRFGTHHVAVWREEDGFRFLVPPGATTAFVEVVRAGRTVSRSAVPFVVTGTSLVSSPRLIGLKEAIDVFGYSETVPEAAKKPAAIAKPVLRLDDQDVLTIGEPGPPSLLPAVQLGDAASAATQGMGPPGFLITARPPKKRYQLPVPTPTP